MQVFLCYARKDFARWHDQYQLIPFLADSLKSHGATLWYDVGGIEPGEKWRARILSAIADSQVAVLLVSQQFLNSDFIREVELPEIESREAQGALKIVPILVEPCLWERIPLLESRQFLPTHPQPLIDLVSDPAKWVSARHRILSKLIERLSLKKPVDENREKTVTVVVPPKPEENGIRSRRAMIMLGIGAVVPAAGFLSYTLVRRWRQAQTRYAFLGALPWLRWIVYDPTDYDPYANRFPSEGSIRTDLRILRSHGLNGLITMTSAGSLGEVPRIAREEGFNQVIAGIWDPRSGEEQAAALAVADHTDSYCIGHAGLGKRYTLPELESAVDRVRGATGRPVTVSELVGDYRTTPRLLDLGDFLFPDVHPSWHDGHTASAAWSETIATAEELAKLIVGKAERPVLLKMVSFPSGGAAGLSPEEQLAFYRLAVERFRDQNRLPARITLAFQGAFDTPWKLVERGWSEPERHTGLFTADRIPKPAIREVRWQADR